MSEKTTLLSEAETEFTLFKRAIAGLDEARMRQVWLGTWSARDVVAHISGWHRELGPALERSPGASARSPRASPTRTWTPGTAASRTPRRARPPPTSWPSSTPRTPPSCGRPPRSPTSAYVPGKTAHKIVDLNSRHHYQEHRAQIEAWRKAG